MNTTGSIHLAPDSVTNLARAREITRTQRTCLPILIELAGLPKAGKTTIINRVKRGLDSLGFSTTVVPEAATVRVDKAQRADLFAFNLQCLLINIQEVVHATSTGQKTDVVIFDRALFDSMVWVDFLSEIGLVSRSQARTLEHFCSQPAWRATLSHIFFLETDWATYQARFSLDSPVQTSSGLSKDYFETLSDCYRKRISKHGAAKFGNPALTSYDCSLSNHTSRPSSLEETWLKTHEVSENIIQAIVDEIVSKGTERIAVVPSSDYGPDIELPLDSQSLAQFIRDVFLRDQDGNTRKSSKAQSVGTPVEWVARSDAELDDSLLQIIASAYFTNNGEYLVLKRSSRELRPELRGRLTILVGGHVDEIDQLDRWGGLNEVQNCLMREIREELSHVDMPTITPRFAIRQSDSQMGQKHLALIHEVETLSRRIEPLQTPGAGDYDPKPEFRAMQWLKEHVADFDPWSQAVIAQLEQ